MSQKVDALKTIGHERKSLKVTKAGYKRCKKAVKDLGLDIDEQIEALIWLEFVTALIDDPEYNKGGRLVKHVGARLAQQLEAR